MHKRISQKVQKIVGRISCACQANPLHGIEKTIVTIFHDFEGDYSGAGRQLSCLKAVEHILDIENGCGVNVTYNTVAQLACEIPELIMRMESDGHEIASHSFDHQVLTKLDEEHKERNVEQAKATFQEIGVQVIGHRSPQSLWDSSLMNILLRHGYLWSAENGREPHPYVCASDGKRSLWRFPVRCDDWRYMTDGYSPNQMLQYWKNVVIDGCRHRKFTAIGVHPWVQANPGRLLAFESLLSWLVSRDDVKVLPFGKVLELVE